MRGHIYRLRIPIRDAAKQGSGCGSGARRQSSSAAAVSGGGGGEGERVVVIVGATGTGKSKLSIDLAQRLAPAEVLNSDKMQVYRGLDVTTNKITVAERRGVPHHLLGSLDPANGELSPAGFRELGGEAVARIVARGGLPIVAGGSNSFVHALLADPYDPGRDPFAGPPPAPVGLRYRCCLLWVDVKPAVLYEHLDRRVDEMLAAGMFEELAANFDPGRRRRGYAGPWRAIGVPEFDRFFERNPPVGSGQAAGRAAAYGAAVEEIKDNTRRLADVQVGKIERLRGMGWALRRVDATAAVRAAMQGMGNAAVGAAWEKGVLRPSMEAVEQFLRGKEEVEGEDEEEEEEEEEEEGWQGGSG